MFASAAYVVLVGAVALFSWRVALVTSFLVPLALFLTSRSGPDHHGPA